jgi:Ferritin-like domain
MFGKQLVRDMISRSSENEADRRLFLKSAGALGLGAVGVAALPSLGGGSAFAAASGPSDGAILNFALNLEYLEGEFYSYAVHGHGLADNLTHGTATRGGVTGGKKVPFKTKRIEQYAREIAGDELAHVKFLRTALGSAAVSRPTIDIKTSFTAAAQAAGLISSHATFDPYANENNFLLAAFLFEDVGVTAYKGAAPLITNKTYLEAAAGILSVEAYHAATIRTSLFEKGLHTAVQKLSDARDGLDGKKDDDQGIHKVANITPTDKNGITYSRSYAQVLNIVYLNPAKTTKGGFFPHGVNGSLNTSA